MARIYRWDRVKSRSSYLRCDIHVTSVICRCDVTKLVYLGGANRIQTLVNCFRVSLRRTRGWRISVGVGQAIATIWCHRALGPFEHTKTHTNSGAGRWLVEDQSPSSPRGGGSYRLDTYVTLRKSTTLFILIRQPPESFASPPSGTRPIGEYHFSQPGTITSARGPGDFAELPSYQGVRR